MGTVGSLFPTSNNNSIAGLTGTSSTQAATSSSNSSDSSLTGADPLANQATFLQLLVAQLKNQNPEQPVDGTTFVTQLAQFSDVEQNLAMRQDMDAVSEKYLGTTTPPSASSSATDAASQLSAGADAAAGVGTTNSTLASSLPQG
jgi:flagellar basal-body rod modification protein FlgD